MSVVIGKDSGQHRRPGIVARQRNHPWSILPYDVTGCGHWRHVAGDENWIGEYRMAAMSLCGWP